MPHLLTDEQKRQRVKVAIKLLQMFPNYDKSSLPISSQVMKPGSIILSPSERLAIRSRPRNTQQTPNSCQTFFECKEGLVCNLLLFSGEGVAIKVPVKKSSLESTTKT